MATDLPNPPYSYFDKKVIDIIDIAFASVGILPSQLVDLHTERAIFYLNEILENWLNDGILQFNELMLPVKLQNDVYSYPLPKEIFDVYDILIASFGRLRTGVYISTEGGNASEAFDNSLSTACTQTAPNGAVGIQFTDPIIPRVDYVGVLSAKEAIYQLIFEGSNDQINWVPLTDASPRKQKFSGIRDLNQIVWLNIRVAQPFTFVRIREIGGATLSIAELYFETFINKKLIAQVGRSTYAQIYTPIQNTNPSLVSVAKNKNNITLNFNAIPNYIEQNQDFGTSGASNNFVLMRAATLPYSFNYMQSFLDINVRFQEALRTSLSAKLAVVYAPDKFEILNAIAESSFKKARKFDSDYDTVIFTMDKYKA